MSFATLACAVALGGITFTLTGTSLWTTLAILAALTFTLIFRSHLILLRHCRWNGMLTETIGNYAGGGVLFGSLQRSFDLFIFHTHHFLKI